VASLRYFRDLATSDLTEKSLGRIWTYNIFPLIEGQMWGDQEQIRHWRWDQVKARFADELLALISTSSETSMLDL
jgi:hypothetical protein